MAQDNFRIWNQALSALNQGDINAYEASVHLLAQDGGFVLSLLLNRVQEDDYPHMARDIINKMSEDDRRKVVSSLAAENLRHGYYQYVIASLNTEWLRANIEVVV